MKNILLIIGLLLLTVGVKADTLGDIQRIRKDMMRAIASESVNDSLFKVMHKTEIKNPVLLAYRGITEALCAKHSWNPYIKVKYLFVSQSTFEKAIALDPDNMEIRFLRFSIEHNCPKLPMFRTNIETDKLVIVQQIANKSYNKADIVFVKGIMNYLLLSKRCTQSEALVLKRNLS